MTVNDGDPELAGRLRAVLGRRHPVAAMAIATAGGARSASIGAPLSADYEIGSVSKGVTGLLYAEALSRSEIDTSTVLGDLLDLAQTPVAAVTLASLCTHRSGLPRLPRSTAALRKTLRLWRHGTNPYGEDVDVLLERARRARVGRPRPHYSNFGFELLGHALGRAAGLDYPDLVRQRVAEPLGLTTFYAPATTEELRPTALIGGSRRGRFREPWTGAALAPAGGLRASITDMGLLAQALLSGAAPGIAALDPVVPFSGRRVAIGAAWITMSHRDRQVTWHNGGTGGFRSWVGLDLERKVGVVLLTATAASVDAQGFTMLAELTQ